GPVRAQYCDELPAAERHLHVGKDDPAREPHAGAGDANGRDAGARALGARALLCYGGRRPPHLIAASLSACLSRSSWVTCHCSKVSVRGESVSVMATMGIRCARASAVSR